jgi:hypothetical protein
MWPAVTIFHEQRNKVCDILLRCIRALKYDCEDRFLRKEMAIVQDERQRVIADLERNATENGGLHSDSVGADEEAQRLRIQMEIMNARILQLETHEVQRQSIPPPVYSPAVNDISHPVDE